MRGSLAVLALFALTSGALAEDAPAPAEALPPAAAKTLKPAVQRADQLDLLFAELRKPGIQTDAVEEKIWALWGASDSPTAEVLLNQAKIAIADGAPAEALSILNRLIGANPDFAEAWNKRATLYFMMKKDDLALADIAHVLDLEPRHFGALAGKGMILERQKKYAAAREAYEEALAVNPALDNVKAALKELDRVEQGI
ncbi:MAG: tetratricopeptide repeat protein [Aestuariivirga sp.]|uniref:tetratricopeptide repeat protein n=1 Tax=Aestuariivirga sp. TaxID=2650926 RepID=UPI0025B7E65E|nr:tetratricopeptide repeat protein [Aestuariivirga sp.]MCA3562029.1 tetratricopeptide repeat protein [Aestuariivirga sp.]